MLSDLNLIDKLNLDDGYVRYEIGITDEDSDGHHHHHLICNECGNIYPFEDDLLYELEEKLRIPQALRSMIMRLSSLVIVKVVWKIKF